MLGLTVTILENDQENRTQFLELIAELRRIRSGRMWVAGGGAEGDAPGTSDSSLGLPCGSAPGTRREGERSPQDENAGLPDRGEGPWRRLMFSRKREIPAGRLSRRKWRERSQFCDRLNIFDINELSARNRNRTAEKRSQF
jgi:hypothetical protein